MSEPPDVIGFTLNEAMEHCSAAGYNVEISITRPVKVLFEGELRVVRLSRVSRDNVVLTVVYEDQGRGGGKSGL